MSKTDFFCRFARWDARVAGFSYGYVNRPIPAKDRENLEFLRGWDEGLALRIDEGLAELHDKFLRERS